jgi:uncharacterized protein (DUF58 family)
MPRFGKTWWTDFRRWLREQRVIWRKDSKNCQATIEIQQFLPLPLVLVALVWYIAAPSAVTLMSLVTLLGIVIGDFMWARILAGGVIGQRRLRYTAMQVGDEMEEEILLHNASSLPVIWAEFVDHSNIPGYTVSSVRGADANSRVHWRAHTVCTRRGIYSLGPWELRLGQPFGLFLVRQIYLQRQEILVYPPMAVLPERIMPHRGQMGDHRPLNQPLRAETVSVNSVRSYQPGDTLRHVHWPTSARRSDLFVKDFAPEAASNIWLVADFYSPDHVYVADQSPGETRSAHHDRADRNPADRHPLGEDSSEEWMVTLVASLAASLLEERLTVGLFACPDDDQVVLPRQGQAHLWSILQALAPLRATPAHPLEEVLARAGALVTGRDLLVVVTPSKRPDWILPLQNLARSRSGSGRAEVILLQETVQNGGLDSAGFAALLRERGIRAHSLYKGDIQLINAYYGALSRWEFTVSATGRAVARNAPRPAALEGAGPGLLTRPGRGG